jgi:hypothetical protein
VAAAAAGRSGGTSGAGAAAAAGEGAGAGEAGEAGGGCTSAATDPSIESSSVTYLRERRWRGVKRGRVPVPREAAAARSASDGSASLRSSSSRQGICPLMKRRCPMADTNSSAHSCGGTQAHAGACTCSCSTERGRLVAAAGRAAAAATRFRLPSVGRSARGTTTGQKFLAIRGGGQIAPLRGLLSWSPPPELAPIATLGCSACTAVS